MKLIYLFSGPVLLSISALAGNLPTITTQPQNQIVEPGNNVTLSVVATGATGFQWRFNGTNVSAGTSSALQITNAQSTNAGYYMAVVKNETGWVPSQMAYLSVVASPGGRVPFSNQGNPSAQACYQVGWSVWGRPITNGSARVVAGPSLDQMEPVGSAVAVNNGYFNSSSGRYVPTVAPGQIVCYRVDITYPYHSGSFTQQSRVLQLVAGGGTYPTPSTANLDFPIWPEWPEPAFFVFDPTNQVRVPGEIVDLPINFYSNYGLGIQWRKDGIEVPNATSRVLTLTNVQAADAGIYDALVFGYQAALSPKYSLSIQLTNGQGVFRSPRLSSTNFVCDLEGAASRNYAIEWSTNLSAWNSLFIVSNVTGTVTFSNALAPGSRRFYRASLLEIPRSP